MFIVITIGIVTALIGAGMAALGIGDPYGLIVALVGGMILALCIWYFPAYEAKRRQHPSVDAIRLCVFLSLFLLPLWFVAAIWAHTVPAPKKTATQKPVTMRREYLSARVRAQEHEREVEAEHKNSQPTTSRSYIVQGVDRDSGFDTELVLDAASEANAKAKAELKGVVVTNVKPA